MAIVLAQSAQVQDDSNPVAGGTLTYGSNVTAGNTLILGLFSWYTAFATSVVVTDTQLNVWTRNSIGTSFKTGTSLIFTAVAGSSGANTLTITAPGGAATFGSFLIEVTTGLLSNPFDTFSTAVDNTTSPVNAGSITPTTNGAYILAYYSRGGVFNSYGNNGVFTVRGQAPSNNTNALYDYVQPTAAAITPDGTATVSASYHVFGQAIPFKASGTTVNKGLLDFF